MTQTAWSRCKKARDRYRREISKLLEHMPQLLALQQNLVNSREILGSGPAYPVETPIVYNSALDELNAGSEIHLILVADNPGRREQIAENRRYLVGPSGKIADKFFRDNPALGIDFRKNVIILNKTPIHTPRTIELKKLCTLGGTALETALEKSQRLMARLLLEFHEALACHNGRSKNGTGHAGTIPVWICGYSEMKKNGVFAAYTDELKAIYGNTGLKESVFLYRHFSMNQFTIDLNRQAAPGETLQQSLCRIGETYRKKFLW